MEDNEGGSKGRNGRREEGGMRGMKGERVGRVVVEWWGVGGRLEDRLIDRNIERWSDRQKYWIDRLIDRNPDRY